MIYLILEVYPGEYALDVIVLCFAVAILGIILHWSDDIDTNIPRSAYSEKLHRFRKVSLTGVG